jgi:hypothetical protein
LDKDNPLRWDVIKLNLPGAPDYSPTLPRVMKWDLNESRMAGEIVTYVDDCRATGATVEQTWVITRQVASRIQHRGMQDAGRKRTSPVRNPGPWAGSVFETSATEVLKTVTLEKWVKAKKYIQNLWDILSGSDWETKMLSYKELEVVRGFLGHIRLTFELIVPYLKGFHLTLSAHLDQRDSEGWKMNNKAWDAYCIMNNLEADEGRHDVEYDVMGRQKPPKEVKAVPLLRDNIYALNEFFSAATPPKIRDQCSQIQVVRYGFGDASGSGFGSTLQTPQGLQLTVSYWSVGGGRRRRIFKLSGVC